MFPDEIGVQQNMSPASMFLSFISSREFFSIITRKIVENFKLNLFDVSLDPFEVKVGFGGKSAIWLKNLDFYYWYCVSANINGYRMLSPSNLASWVSIVSSIYLRKTFVNQKDYFLCCILTIYLLHFVFASKIKIFPYADNTELNFNWFVELFWSFYPIVLHQFWSPCDPSVIESFKKKTLKQTDLFCMLYYSYQHVASVFSVDDSEYQDFMQWLFYDESKKQTFQESLHDYLNHMTTYRHSISFSLSEQKLISTLIPADILIKYLFDHESIDLIVGSLCTSLFDKDKLDSYLRSFLKNDNDFEAFIFYITDYQLLKTGFFQWVQNFFTQYRYHQSSPWEIQKINEFMSSIGDIQSLDGQVIPVPETIKNESFIMERLMNFYITNVGWLRVGRWDNFFIRIFKRQLLQNLMTHSSRPSTQQHEALQYYGSILYAYSKNIFYYTYAFANIKAWKEKFHLPFKSALKEVYSSMFLLKLFDEWFRVVLLQDINVKDIKLFVQQKNILRHFKKDFATRVSYLTLQDNDVLLKNIYSPIEQLLPSAPFLVSLLSEHLVEKDIASLKENLYNVNFWIFHDFVLWLLSVRQDLAKSYPISPIVGILASVKETLFWLLLFLSYCHSKSPTSHDADKNKRLILEFYCGDVLNLQDHLHDSFIGILLWLLQCYQPICYPRIDIDDNKQFLTIGYSTWLQFTHTRIHDPQSHQVLGEDVIRFRWYLKNISYYNNRFLLSKDI